MSKMHLDFFVKLRLYLDGIMHISNAKDAQEALVAFLKLEGEREKGEVGINRGNEEGRIVQEKKTSNVPSKTAATDFLSTLMT